MRLIAAAFCLWPGVNLPAQDFCSAILHNGISDMPPDAGCCPIFGVLLWYFRPENGGNPGIAE